ncbi:GNAT family N-acetyltransferase [Octadecabacter sp. CECT 8868]|uniref:GNAT family N-acetyltransferase n=1 Tax=Octadecabacter algicola TaxID=2909342 RepID=UPI001F15A139|nr:GNAT family protein [Octadecabacter algicola]MCF2905246.1 GNAT family N-acetyltransferase [Octadecabacter algicola]
MNGEERPVGPSVDFVEAKQVGDAVLEGRSVRLEPIDPVRHGPAIWSHMDGHDYIWDYLYEEPPLDEAGLVSILEAAKAKPDWQGFAICLPDLGPVGYAFYLNIVPGMGSIEVGNINFAPVLQRTVAATEAMFLMMRAAFEAGYRRYEWKCNALNLPSRRAAQRYGFSWEGIFRQHLIVKGRNRDTAWLAITDGDWSDLRCAFETWLAPDNFDGAGQQYQALRDLTDRVLVNRDPAQEPVA